ncbi:MAG TPA: helix-turn-helix transcriptional regulator [Bacteroidales bacterium]|nr:helix-turn-helix transcriptional regulator [Bacteroidales bacterium]HOX77743.1 helix-turn-helix transcriptional regulator [Bacteroidales bacterium]HPM92476.1 helix-turn-helix transcriptional regulator [Bacteroidales bacterium]
MIDRFRQLMADQGLSASEFADRIGVQRSSISHILSGRNKPSIDFLEKIKTAFPEADLNWLVSGKKSATSGLSTSPAVSKTVPVSLPPTLFEAEENNEIQKKPVHKDDEPVEQIIMIFRNGTFRVLKPESGKDQ